MSVAYVVDYDHRNPSQYVRCSCGNWKWRYSKLCNSCYVQQPGSHAYGKPQPPETDFVACGCGRERPKVQARCAACRGDQPERCVVTDCEEWGHCHCANCGQPCAVNWPLCQECDSAWCLIRRHTGAELGKQSHGNVDRVIAGRSRRKVPFATS